MSAQPPPLALELEAPGVAAEVAVGFWVLATRHHGGGFTRFPEANNRSFVMRLVDGGQAGLVLVNATDPAQSFAEVHRLCTETGLQLSHVVSPGGGHHSYMGAWHAEFPSAQLLIGERVATTSNGRGLLELDQVTVMDLADPLPMFAGQLDAHAFTGLLGPGEFDSPTEGKADSMWNLMKAMPKLLSSKEHYDDLWLRHVASNTVIAGENLAPWWSREAHAEMPYLVRKSVEAEVVTIPKQGRKIWDAEQVATGWRTVSAWPATTLLHMHDTVGGGFVGDVPAALRAAALEAGELPA